MCTIGESTWDRTVVVLFSGAFCSGRNDLICPNSISMPLNMHGY
jgi:hypothetical protein